MSVRTNELVDHVRVRGTHISTSPLAPSKMHVSVVQTLGLPGPTGTLHCDGHILTVKYDTTNSAIVHVWAKATDEESQLAGYCIVA